MKRGLIVLWLAVGCGGAEPAVPLPDPLPPAPVGRFVKAGAVEGFLVRPRTQDGPWPGVLLMPAVLDAEARAQAEALAAEGRIVLAIGPKAEVAPAERYLAGMPSTTTTTRVCQREECP